MDDRPSIEERLREIRAPFLEHHRQLRSRMNASGVQIRPENIPQRLEAILGKPGIISYDESRELQRGELSRKRKTHPSHSEAGSSTHQQTVGQNAQACGQAWDMETLDHRAREYKTCLRINGQPINVIEYLGSNRFQQHLVSLSATSFWLPLPRRRTDSYDAVRAKKIATTEVKGKGKGKTKATDADMNTDNENLRDDSQEESDALDEPDQDEDNGKEAAEKGPKQWMSKSKEATETSAPVQSSFDIFDVDQGHHVDFGNQQNQVYPPIATDGDAVLAYGNGSVPIDPALENYWPESYEVPADSGLEVQGTQDGHELPAEPGSENHDME
ncbi:hypothetical protein NM208_g5853 [Fusarium decemcellulare]|uniref:Uncharacterized protein n=1 Tax=Fusarium decemcellulare TaxID=57161 RepID=A0ACC1SFG6_9HYPO|nr:hypothetical protein NM208_g5853 [Fusarium decemcellulare]